MGRTGARRREKRKKSDNSENNDSVCKAGKFYNSPQNEDLSVSRLLKETNSVLFDGDVSIANLFNDQNDNNSDQDSDQDNFSDLRPSENTPPTHTRSAIMESSNISKSGNPTNADLMDYLKKMNKDVNERMDTVEKKLEKMDVLEKKVDSFEKEVAKMWNYVQDQTKRVDDRMRPLEDKVESVDFSLGVVNDKVVHIEKERDALKDEFVYLQSQSMRNNIVFGNIPEVPKGKTEDCEKELRGFLAKEMKIAQDLVDKLTFERVHRMGQQVNGRSRKIVAKFTLFKEREMVRKQWKSLADTDFYIHEQYPREVVDKRRKLLPKLKEAKKDNKRAWLSYDTLYIDGKPWRGDSSSS